MPRYFESCVAVAALCAVTGAAGAASGEITIIHIGDIHGHLAPRVNVRSDSSGKMEGGLARMAAKIQEIRKANKNTLLINSGDTIQGSAEALYTRGQALVDVVNLFGLDAYAPGNWEFVYGTGRFLELFAGEKSKAPWNTVAANVYFSKAEEDKDAPYAARGGQRVLPPYIIRQVGGLKVGILGLTTRRGPQVVGRAVTKGFRFTSGDAELKGLVPLLREKEKVDLLILISEQELANNVRMAEAYPGIDVVLSSDMHEVTRKPIVAKTGTLLIEEGQDGTVLGELRLKVENGKLASWDWKPHVITSDIREDRVVAAKVAEVRRSFISGKHFARHVNPFNGSKLKRPIDTVVGYTMVPLHRSNFSREEMPALIEGSSHDFLTDAFRYECRSDIGAIRGFRYGTHVAKGSLTMEDLYHFIPIGPQIACGTIKGRQLKNQIENSASGSLDPDMTKWTGGWLFNFSGVTFDFDPWKPNGQRASNIRVGGKPLNPEADYTYASYWYAADPDLINVVPSKNIRVVKDDDGSPMDGTEAVVRYVRTWPERMVRTDLNRIRLTEPLPAPRYGFPEIQPLAGAKR